MNRTEALQFLHLYSRFILETDDYVKILDIDSVSEQVELKVFIADGDPEQRWVDYWTAAKIMRLIVTNSLVKVLAAFGRLFLLSGGTDRTYISSTTA